MQTECCGADAPLLAPQMRMMMHAARSHTPSAHQLRKTMRFKNSWPPGMYVSVYLQQHTAGASARDLSLRQLHAAAHAGAITSAHPSAARMPRSPDHGQELDDEQEQHQDGAANLRRRQATRARQAWLPQQLLLLLHLCAGRGTTPGPCRLHARLLLLLLLAVCRPRTVNATASVPAMDARYTTVASALLGSVMFLHCSARPRAARVQCACCICSKDRAAVSSSSVVHTLKTGVHDAAHAPALLQVLQAHLLGGPHQEHRAAGRQQQTWQQHAAALRRLRCWRCPLLLLPARAPSCSACLPAGHTCPWTARCQTSTVPQTWSLGASTET